MQRRRFYFQGQIQGVGFRPYLYRQAGRFALNGFVRNTPDGVIMEVQGAIPEGFIDDLKRQLPPMARIDHLRVEDIAPLPDAAGFFIMETIADHGGQTLIGPDTATCPACERDIFDPADRRYLYPFTNCTDCGPRYSITRALPYDRQSTTMGCFAMCSRCREEYENPADRRFHAQPNACPECGPRVWLSDVNGLGMAEGRQAVLRAAQFLAEGRIVAVKGLGGFHLSCSAFNDLAVAELRRRKNRPAKALAVMTADLPGARDLAHLDHFAEGHLAGPQRPITLVPAKKDVLSPLLNPDTALVGLMTAYTPLHHALFAALRDIGGPPALVMTSGNQSGRPLATGNRQALDELAGLADVFLLHNRDILIRVDDSVIMKHPRLERTVFIRRSRGYAPQPIRLDPELENDGPPILAFGADLKNTLCLLSGRQAIVSQHIGDLGELAVNEFCRRTADHLQSLFGLKAGMHACDLHPDFHSAQLALRMASEASLEVVRVQHHIAHAAALLAENACHAPALVLVLDGTGYGPDGTIWGGEALYLDMGGPTVQRCGRLSPVSMPGGEAAVREPWRMAMSFLHAMGVKAASARRLWPWAKAAGEACQVVGGMLEHDFNCPKTSSCGRLFDAVAALLGVVSEIDYEAQAAVLLENIQDVSVNDYYAARIEEKDGLLQLDAIDMFARVYAEWKRGVGREIISRRFHLGLANGLADMACTLAERVGTDIVGLSGGVMLNRTLSAVLPELIGRRGCKVLEHVHLPPGDGCISFGQAVWVARLKRQPKR